MKSRSLRNIGKQLSFESIGVHHDNLDADDPETEQDFETFKKWLADVESNETPEVPSGTSASSTEPAPSNQPPPPIAAPIAPPQRDICRGCKAHKSKCISTQWIIFLIVWWITAKWFIDIAHHVPYVKFTLPANHPCPSNV